MTQRARTLIAEARALTRDEREEIIAALVASLDAGDAQSDDTWAAEGKRRLEAYRSGEIEAQDADVAMTEVCEALRARRIRKT